MLCLWLNLSSRKATQMWLSSREVKLENATKVLILALRGLLYFFVLYLLYQTLLPQWGYFDYTSSLHPNRSNIPFTGLDVFRQQSILLCLMSCFVPLVLLGLVALVGSVRRLWIFKRLSTWDVFLLISDSSACVRMAARVPPCCDARP